MALNIIKTLLSKLTIFFRFYKEFIIILFIIILIINLIFFSIYFNSKILIFIYNEFFIEKIDYLIYFFKKYYINLLNLYYKNFYNLKIWFIQKYYDIFEYDYIKNILKKNNEIRSINLYDRIKKNIYKFFYKNILFPYFNLFQNTEYYKKFDPKMYGLDFIYSYKRKGECGLLIREDLFEYIPNYRRYIKGKRNFLCLTNLKFTNLINNHYNYIYTFKYVRHEKCLTNYNNLYLRRNFFIYNNSGFLPNKELLQYCHDAEAASLDDMGLWMEKSNMRKISAFNYRRKNPKIKLTSFENFDKFNNHPLIIAYDNAVAFYSKENPDITLSNIYIDRLRYKIFIKFLKTHNYYDNIVKFNGFERDIDNFYITGTTEIYYFNKRNHLLINFIGLSDYFFYFFYYSFLEIPFFFEDFYTNIHKKINYYDLFKKFINEFFKLNNFYIIFIFLYSIYIGFRCLILNELDLLYCLLFFKRHLNFLLILAFIMKFNLELLDPISFELFLILWIPGFINYIVYEEWWWVWWTNFEKVKYHYTFNYEGVLYGPMNICIAYIIIPFYFQNFLIFKFLILYYLIFHFNRVDLKWKYIIKKNIFYYFYLLYTLIFYNLYIFKEELNLLKTRFKYKKDIKTFDIFFINFNVYSRNILINLNNKVSISFLTLLKKYIQYIIFYLYMFIFILFINLMLFKILYNINFIYQLSLLENNLQFKDFILNNFILLKNNFILSLFQEYQIIQRDHYYKYNIIYDFKNTKGLKNKLHYKFHYPGLIFYRTSKQFNGNMYWLYFQGGNNYIGEIHYKATILNSFYKKNIPYFYKHFLLDSKNNDYWTIQHKFKYAKVSEFKKRLIKKRQYKRFFPNVAINFKKRYTYKNFIRNNFNFINFTDLKFISLITKHFYKTTTFYTNNKTFYFSDYNYLYFSLNYPGIMEDLEIDFFTRRMYLEVKAWGKYHMGSNYAAAYCKFMVKKRFGYDFLTNLILHYRIHVPFKSFIEENSSHKINNILTYNKYIPNRLDYIEFHRVFMNNVYMNYDNELKRTLSEIGLEDPAEIVEEEKITIFTLLFNYKKYLEIKEKTTGISSISIDTKGVGIYDVVEKKREYI